MEKVKLKRKLATHWTSTWSQMEWHVWASIQSHQSDVALAFSLLTQTFPCLFQQDPLSLMLHQKPTWTMTGSLKNLKTKAETSRIHFLI